MIAGIILAAAMASSTPVSHEFVCTGRPEDWSEEIRPERVVEIRFFEFGRKLENVTVVNPPEFAFAVEPTDRVVSTKWRGKRTNAGFAFKSTERRWRRNDGALEPGRVELTPIAGSNDTFAIQWRASLSGGHMAFADAGEGTCKHSITPISNREQL